MTTTSAGGLRWDARAATLSNRTLKALYHAGIKTWDDLTKEAQRTPNVIRGIEGIGAKGIGEIKTALATAKVEHTIRSGRHR